MSEIVETGRKEPLLKQRKEDIHLSDLTSVLTRHKKLVLGAPLVAGLMALVTSLLMPPTFVSVATIMPPQQQNAGALAMLGQLGGLANVAGGMAGLKNPNDLYVGMLESRTIADRLIERFALKKRYEVQTMDEARKSLRDVVEISSGKNGLIAIQVEDKNPQVAANLANAFVEELVAITKTLAITEASQRRLFFQAQLENAKDQLANSEVSLRKTQEATGMIQPEGQVQGILASVGKLQGEIAAKEVQLNSMRTFATNNNPDVIRTQEELRGLKGQLGSLQKRKVSHGGDLMIPTQTLPKVGEEYVRKLRDVKYHETVFELLAKQFELAKIDEAKEVSVIQQLDKAVPAERKAKPRRALLTIAGTLFGLLLGMLLAFYAEYRHQAKKTGLAGSGDRKAIAVA